MLIHLDLFSGIGGFALACEWNGIETIGFVEIDKFCQKVLIKHWPNVPIVEDIRDVEKIKGIVADAKISQDNKRDARIMAETQRYGQGGNTTFGISNQYEPTTAAISPSTVLVTAGFPCQPFSIAGKQLSQGDDRYLWPQTLAVIKAVKPKWVLLENVTGIINLALDTVLSDLEGAGYSYETLIIPACAVNAWHRRDRIWVVANCANNRFSRPRISIPERRSKQEDIDIGRKGQDAALAKCKGQTDDSRSGTYENMDRQSMPNRDNRQNGEQDIWSIEPELGRVANGIPNRVDRLKCLGNAIVPQVAYEIIKRIYILERICR
jgi:DNA (cytosine-5)-methyltransferase 1